MADANGWMALEARSIHSVSLHLPQLRVCDGVELHGCVWCSIGHFIRRWQATICCGCWPMLGVYPPLGLVNSVQSALKCINYIYGQFQQNFIQFKYNLYLILVSLQIEYFSWFNAKQPLRLSLWTNRAWPGLCTVCTSRQQDWCQSIYDGRIFNDASVEKAVKLSWVGK